MGYQDFESKLFCNTTPKTLARYPCVLCFNKLPVAKKIMDKREGGISRFSVENFLSHNAENFRKGTICVVFQ